MTHCKHLENAAAALANAYGQATSIRNRHGAFPAAYTNLKGMTHFRPGAAMIE